MRKSREAMGVKALPWTLGTGPSRHATRALRLSLLAGALSMLLMSLGVAQAAAHHRDRGW